MLAPCALGGAITVDNVKRLKCRAIGGAANNQLRTPEAGHALAARNIFYAPDYAINAGGLINVADEHRGYDRTRATQKTLAIYETIKNIIERSKNEKALPEKIADRIAEEILQGG